MPDETARHSNDSKSHRQLILLQKLDSLNCQPQQGQRSGSQCPRLNEIQITFLKQHSLNLKQSLANGKAFHKIKAKMN